MKPRTKLQKAVAGSISKLPALSKYQLEEAIKKVSPHIAKFSKKSGYVCLDCGHTWKAEEKDKVICPHCSHKLDVSKDRKRKYITKHYIATITTCNGFQVYRMFLLTTFLTKGKKAKYWCDEAFQRWLTPDGVETIVSRARNLSWYYDNWNWGSDLEIRKESHAHSVEPYAIVGQYRFLPKLVRNGLRGASERCLHNIDAPALMKVLLTNNKIESLWKRGEYALIRFALKRPIVFERYYPSIMVALRHKYGFILSDEWSDWVDTLNLMENFGKDIRNPKLICFEDLQKAHEYWIKKTNEQRAKDRLTRQREEAKKDEARFLAEKKQYFDLKFETDNLIVQPLKSVREFVEEGERFHHCVFANRYYLRPDSLIMHAISDGKPIATIEFSLKDFKVLQCRGVCNKVPPKYDEIINLIQENIKEIAKCKSKTA